MLFAFFFKALGTGLVQMAVKKHLQSHGKVAGHCMSTRRRIEKRTGDAIIQEKILFGEFDQQRVGAGVLGQLHTALIFCYFWIKPKVRQRTDEAFN